MRGDERKQFEVIGTLDSMSGQFAVGPPPQLTGDGFDANVQLFGSAGATIIEGCAFEVLGPQQLAGRRVRVFAWDADHSEEGQLCGLSDIEPRPALRSLLICDNADPPAATAARRLGA